jgi:hypothetical protein
MKFSTPDLTQHPPRGARVRLGGYVIVPRMLDKCRASIAGKNGEYHYACPLDQRFLQFAGINPDALKAEVAKGLSDSEILAWIQANASIKHTPVEIAQWSCFQASGGPTNNESREYFNELVAGAKADKRDDIAGWFDLLDVDDYVTFGGKP